MLFPKPSYTREKAAAKRRQSVQDQSVYRAVAERDGGRCRHCGDRWHLELHHIVYRSAQDPTSTPNVATLCRNCHYEVHQGRLVITGDADRVLVFARRAA